MRRPRPRLALSLALLLLITSSPACQAADPKKDGGAAPAAAAAQSTGNSSSARPAASPAPQPRANATRPVVKPIAVQAVQPGSVTLFVANRVTVDVNGSLCANASSQARPAGKGGPANATVLLQLRGARKDGKDAVFAGNATGNCTRAVFAISPDGGLRSGAFPAVLSLASGGPALQLPGNFSVVRPLTVTMASRSLQLPANGSARELRVALSGPSKGAVSVKVQLTDGALQFVGGDTARWAPGESGPRSLQLRLAAAPRAGNVTARIVDGEGDAVVPAADAEADVWVLSPVLSYEPTGTALYRGSAGSARIPLRLNGTSAYPSSWNYTTYFLPGSRPADNSSCAAAGGYRPGCGLADWDARANLTVKGTLWVSPGQTALPALSLPEVDWRRVPYEAEYMVGVRLTPLFNARAAPQPSDAGAVVYGAPQGHCPPGTVLRRGAARRPAGDDPMYGPTAALQELYVSVEGLGGGAANSSAAGGTSALDLDPPFKPLTDGYTLLLPHTARSAELLIASTRDGDTVTVDASGCNALVSKDYQVAWRRGAHVWRARYGLRPQRRPCWLRVHVFTSGALAAGGGGGGGDEDALQPQAAAAQDARDAERGGAQPPALPPAQEAVDGEGVRRVLYRTYTLRFVPLSPPQALALRAVSFSNATATLVACGVPSRLSHLFVPPRAAPDDARRPLPAPLAAAPGQRPTVAYYLNAPASAAASEALLRQGQPTQALYSLADRKTNQTVLWSQFSLSECSHDRFLLAPLPQVLSLGADARMMPELLDASAQGVRVGMSGAALALSAEAEDALAAAAAAAAASGNSSSSSLVALLKGASTGIGGIFNVSRAANASGNSSAPDADAGPLGAPRLPGASLELPVITTADDGLSSKTFTLVLYSNISSALTLSRMQPASAGNASSADGDAAAAATRRPHGTQLEDAEEEARLQRDAFGSRPRAWPRSPGQSANCSLCAAGTYSTRLDAHECQVCPPGKFSAAPFSPGCRLCPEGSFSYFWGAAACRTCLPGTFAPGRGSLYCDICPDGLTTLGEGAAECGVSVNDLATPEYVIMLSFGVVLSGASLGAVSRATTGINGNSEGIVAVLVRSDTASALNVPLEAVTIAGVQQLSQRRLLVNVSAAVPFNTEGAAAADTQDLSADMLIQRLIEDPNAFLRTTQTLGAESAAVTDLTTETRHNRFPAPPNLHAVLWPTLAGLGLLSSAAGLSVRTWRRRRRRRNGGGGGGGGGGARGGLEPIARAGSGLGGYAPSDGDSRLSGFGGGGGRGPRWWGRVRGAVAGAAAGRRRGAQRLEVAFADFSTAGGGRAGGGVSGGAAACPDIDVERSPREDSFAAMLRQKKEGLFGAAAALQHADADAEVDVSSRFGGGGGGGASDSAGSQAGPPSDVADSAVELAVRGGAL
ncbi:hypothetical protein Rsub_12295 [Raphidocelis subcapitata]|uniref:Tyrosine-protein kinase ephrin type A/B receptor-like domain-containing protein n=1 Tax=Raphidocelis subcapitata TaxID=307507 RepID=A0A2V0PIS5_9CHLO|nr:hypothetical protein Rsub_12295 [Raphidocelis subcapitata]|eukprot:GBF99616.1 hypothetical protein Rsub_12295 [Raphidocelis subcapitata]